MRRHGRTGLGALFILAIFLSFAACGEKKGSGKESGSETGVASVNYEMEYAEGEVQGVITHFHFGGSVLYRSEEEGKFSKLYRREPGTEQDELVLTTEKGERLLDFATLSDGRIVAAILTETTEGMSEENNGSDSDGKINEESRGRESETTYELTLRIYDGAGTLQKRWNCLKWMEFKSLRGFG